MDWITIILLILAGYLLLAVVLSKSKLLEKYNFSFSGPLLMWRTQRGRGVIDAIARPKRFWSRFGVVSIALCFVIMVLITLLLVLSFEASFSIPSEDALGPEYIIGFPGINPMIPIGYGIIAFIAAIVIHEFMHGIIARANDIKVKSLGAVFFVLPIGAFTEPDDEEMLKMPRFKRMKIYAAGPASNVMVALIFALLFSSFIGAAIPKADGLVVSGIVPNGPADLAGIEPGMQIIQVNNQSIDSQDDIYAIAESVPPLEPLHFTVMWDDEVVQFDVPNGVLISSVTAGFPAEAAGLEPGMVFAWIAVEHDGTSTNTTITTLADFNDVLSASFAGDQATIGAYTDNGELQIVELTLADKYDYYPQEEFRGKAFLGVSSSWIGLAISDVSAIVEQMAHPYRNAETPMDYFIGTIFYISMPVPWIGLSPVPEYITDLYSPSGILGALPDSVFWILANTFYWIFWLNIMLGLTNALPAVPLDGGYILRDGLALGIQRIKKDIKPEALDAAIVSATRMLGIVILLLILAPLIVPRLFG